MCILLTRIYDYEDQRVRVSKALKLNGDISLGYSPRLLAASSKKPTIRIKRLDFSGSASGGIKLRGASAIMKQKQKEREKAEKALRLNGF